MGDMETYVLSIVFFLVLCGIFYLWKINRKKNYNQDQYINNVMELARSQFEIFNIKLQKSDNKSGLSAILHDIDKAGLHMEVGDFVSEEWDDALVDVYFKVQEEGDPVFYVFSSRILRLKADYEASVLLLQLPQHLQIEKKRHFVRVHPKKNDINFIGVWPLSPGRRLPRIVEQIGKPFIFYKTGTKEELVQLENISGAGFALRIRGELPNSSTSFSKGSHLLCVIGFIINNKSRKFACTGEIMNIRYETGNVPVTVVGLEFLNWAVMEEGQDEIHWTHCSPTRGAKPILNWIQEIEKDQRKTEG